MVGSLHAARAIPSDRPIGQSLTGAAIAAPVKKPGRGQPTPPAAWKQTDDYRRLSAMRDLMVRNIKTTPASDLVNTSHVEDLRDLERQLKALKPSAKAE